MRAFAAFLIVASATAAALAFVAGTADAPPSHPRTAADTADAPPAATPEHVRPGALLDHAPYLGVACRRPDSTRCDRIGLAVWTRRDVDALRGSVGGRRLALRYVGPGGSAAMFVGYLHPAGLRDLRLPLHWEGRRRPSLRVRLWATLGGQEGTTTLRVPLQAGWG